MARDRIYTSAKYKETIDELKSKDILGLSIVEGKEGFFIAMALGLNNPEELKNKVGLFLNTALKTSDKALMASVLLGKAGVNDEIDSFCDEEARAELCEKCAEAGYRVLLKKVMDADGDEELLERRLMKELDSLYLQNVENNI